MNRLLIFTGCVLFVMGGNVWAGCTANTRVQPGTAISNLLQGQTVCGIGVNNNAGDKWQEFHQSGGGLIEFAKGPQDTVDPTHPVGTWSTSGTGVNSTITYNYDSSGPYTFSVHSNTNGTYSFCSGGAEVATATLKSGQVSCQF